MTSWSNGKSYPNTTLTGGIPQCSVLGPTLWNVMHGAVLRQGTPESTRIIWFADDIAAEQGVACGITNNTIR